MQSTTASMDAAQAVPMIMLTVDGVSVSVPQGSTVFQACAAAGIEIPRFCYHERLSIAGNCRMCLVEIEGGPPKPAASCAMPAAQGMVVHTKTPMVRQAREGVMEFLLLNHPLDCPICDQGGECDLQDQAMAYGAKIGRTHEARRAVSDKQMGPLIATHMTRCIHCTRCVRFAQEVAGVEELGTIGRGEHMEITTYLEQTVGSELSGNLVDLCPVGALTSAPYAFRARPWELTKTESIDVMDALGSHIRVDSRGREVIRILPRTCEAINAEWISDVTRHACDGLALQRLDQPMVRNDQGRLEPVTWEVALEHTRQLLSATSAQNLAALSGDLVSVEAMYLLRVLCDYLGTPHRDCRQDGAALDVACRAAYRFNTTLEGIERTDACLLIGTNPRYEAPLLQARLRKRFLAGQRGRPVQIGLIGPEVVLTHPYQHLGSDPKILRDIASFRHPWYKVLQEAKAPMLILGQAALARSDGALILGLARSIAEHAGLVCALADGTAWHGFNVLHTAAARVGGLEVGLLPGITQHHTTGECLASPGYDTRGILHAAQEGKVQTVILLGADELPMASLGKAKVIYLGHHGDAGAHRADIILPSAAYTEQSGIYVNTEGRVQHARAAVSPPGEARPEWQILSRILTMMGATGRDYTQLALLRDALYQEYPYFSQSIEGGARFSDHDGVAPAALLTPEERWGVFGTERGVLSDEPIAVAPYATARSWYMANVIARASRTMAACAAACADGAVQDAA